MNLKFIALVRRVFSSRNPALVVALVDSVVAFGASLLGLMLLTGARNLLDPNPHNYYWVDYGTVWQLAVIIAVATGAMSALCTTNLRGRPYLVRSVKRSLVASVGLFCAMSTLILAVVFVTSEHFWLLDATNLMVMLAPFSTNAGYRLLGFTDPNRIDELPAAGTRDALTR